MTGTRINERAWAVDVISEINRISASRIRPVRSAGGEWGVPIASGGKVLFPDVLLFGDPANSAVIQGWELKMPDTPITDGDLLANAEKKCRALGLSGFVVWNARDAVLYRVTNIDVYPLKSWQCLDIKTREDVRVKRASWIKVLVQIFKPCLGSKLLQEDVWKTLLGFNGILISVRLQTIDQGLLQSTLSTVRRESQRKISGQFCTPRSLADLLVKMTINDIADPVLDPCCGTGTIARAVLDFKISSGMSAAKALSTTWAADKYAVPLQFATMSLASGETPRETIHTFQHDAMSLIRNEKIQFIHAGDGHEFFEKLPDFPCVIVNPPFVRFEDWSQDDPAAQKVLQFVAKTSGRSISGKADIFAPIIFNLWRIVSASNGRVGAVFPNTWLGTDWGASFRDLLKQFFKIEVIVTSAKGRWFEHAKVVTNLVILGRRPLLSAPKPSESVIFATTDMPLSAWSDETTTMIADVLGMRKAIKNSPVTFHEVTQKNLDEYDQDGFCWTAHFASLKWVERLREKLVSVSDLFDVKRGERRGWDDLFYPSDDSNIPPEYLKPVLISASEVDCLAPQPAGRAFCCSESVENLTKMGDHSALAWIRRFEHVKNGAGKPLKEVLARGGLRWYEMRPDTLADFAVSMNPNERLFFMRLVPRSFVNQRLIRLTAKVDSSPEMALCHALLCSVTSCFYLEALGFGRGLGVLDLNAGKISRQFKMLNPVIFSDSSKKKILSCFQPLLKRTVYGFEKEMACKDRLAFERAILNGLGNVDLLPSIISSTLRLHRIRLTARE